jgi:hypothetical protein
MQQKLLEPILLTIHLKEIGLLIFTVSSSFSCTTTYNNNSILSDLMTKTERTNGPRPEAKPTLLNLEQK